MDQKTFTVTKHDLFTSEQIEAERRWIESEPEDGPSGVMRITATRLYRAAQAWRRKYERTRKARYRAEKSSDKTVYALTPAGAQWLKETKDTVECKCEICNGQLGSEQVGGGA